MQEFKVNPEVAGFVQPGFQVPPTPDWLPHFSSEGHWATQTALSQSKRPYISQEERDYYQNVAFYTDAFCSGQDEEWQGRHVTGPQYGTVNGVLQRTDNLLRRHHPQLTPGVMINEYYRSSQDTQLLRHQEEKFPGTMQYVTRLRKARARAIDRVVDQNMDLACHALPTGLLSEPEFIQQRHVQSCTTATFAMVLAGLACETPYVMALENSIVNVYRDTKIHDEEYLKLLSSPAISKRFGAAPQIFSFTGGDLEFVAQTVQKLRARLPDAKVLCAINILSNSTPETRVAGIWHSNILLGADQDSVYVHDPAKPYGANLQLDKIDFYKRWMQAYGRGHIIIG